MARMAIAIIWVIGSVCALVFAVNDFSLPGSSVSSTGLSLGSNSTATTLGTAVPLSVPSAATSTSTSTSTSIAEQSAVTSAAVETGQTGIVNTEFGEVLADDDGRAIYLFTRDRPGLSTCYEPCSTTWPIVDPETATAVAGMTELLPGGILRKDGTRILSLDGMPVYLFVDDKGPGDALGQGIGNVWFLLSPTGEMIVPPSVRGGSTDAGDVLIDPRGHTLYTFLNDPSGATTCYSPCSDRRVPVPGDTNISLEFDLSQFDKLAREDGTTQLTFQGKALYTYIGDAHPGDAEGDVGAAGELWDPIPFSEVENAKPTVLPAGIHSRPTPLGEVMVDQQERTVYADLSSQKCVAECAQKWIPVPGETPVDDHPDAANHDIIERSDGITQFTYAGLALYTYTGDTIPGDTSGHGIDSRWSAIDMTGKPVR